MQGFGRVCMEVRELVTLHGQVRLLVNMVKWLIGLENSNKLDLEMIYEACMGHLKHPKFLGWRTLGRGA